MIPFWQIDAFTDTIFSGNPAAVFPVQSVEAQHTNFFQNIAMEMNLSETVFVAKNDDASWNIRWFTPNTEVNLCGHATLAAAHVLFSEGLAENDEIIFHSLRSGQLKAKKQDTIIWLDFPLQPAIEKPAYGKNNSLAQGNAVTYSGSNGSDAVIVFAQESAVLHYQPDYAAIAQLPDRGLLITAQSSMPNTDYVYRAFFPKLNILEDPVTGSAHTLLAPYWTGILKKDPLKAFQASPRGGRLLLTIEKERVKIGGQAVAVFQGTFFSSL